MSGVLSKSRAALITSPFLSSSSLEELLSAKAFVCFSCCVFFFFFSSTRILEQYCQFLSWLLSKSGIWHVPQIVSVMKRKACLTWHLFSCREGQSLCSVLMVKEGMASGIVIIWINYSGALINETEVLSDLDRIQFFNFFLCTIQKQPQFSDACF